MSLRLAWVLGSAVLAAACAPADADTDDDDDVPVDRAVDQGDFVVSHEAAVDPYLADWGDYLASLGVLESMAEGINATFALPHDAYVLSGECGMANAFWSPEDDAMVMCHELVADVATAFTESGWGLTEDQVVGATVNTYAWVGYHEMGHALVDLLDLPITGREEDAVDEFSTILFVEAGSGGAAIDAGLYFYLMDDGAHAPSALADEHALGLQRFYNVLCLVYGSAPDQYGDVVSAFPEMESRAPRCQDEYEQKVDAWTRLLEPHTL